MNVVFYRGWVWLAYRIKGVFIRFAKSYVRRCFGNGQGSYVVGLGDLQRSVNSNHSDTIIVCKLVLFFEFLTVGCSCLQGKRRATLIAVFLMLFEENWVVLGLSLFAWVVGFYLFIHLLIYSLIYLLNLRLRQD